MHSIILIILSILIFNIECSSSKSFDDIKMFMNVLFNEPTISDYYYFYGEGAEGEIQIVSIKCEDYNWVPINKDKTCIEYINNHLANPDSTPSLYLKWLRNKLPNSANIKIQRVTPKRTEQFEYEIIEVKIDNVDVNFFRTISVEYIQQFGKISISKINNVPIADILEVDIKSRKVPIP